MWRPEDFYNATMWDFEDAYNGYLESKGVIKRLVDRNEYKDFKEKVEAKLEQKRRAGNGNS